MIFKIVNNHGIIRVWAEEVIYAFLLGLIDQKSCCGLGFKAKPYMNIKNHMIDISGKKKKKEIAPEWLEGVAISAQYL